MKSKVVKNSMLLYSRMLLTLVVGLYTSRLILATLGVEDFGIYSVIAGAVSLIAFMNISMTSSMQRFFSIAIGENNTQDLSEKFSVSLVLQLLISLLFILICETVGFWFLNEKMSIPTERLQAAQSVYHIIIVTSIFSFIQTPFTALIIAKEKFDVYAKFSILEVIIKLALVYVLVNANYEKLQLHALLMLFLTFLIALLYISYWKLNFKDIKLTIVTNINAYKSISNYTAWIAWGNLAGTLKIHGGNVILNIFFGPVVNSAYGVHMQISNIINMLVSNFTQAINPQIFKSYAKSSLVQFQSSVIFSSRVSFCLVYFVGLPIILLTQELLEIWLVEPPEFTAIFIKLAVINLIVDSAFSGLYTAILATGKIKCYQLIVSSITLLFLPLTYILYANGLPPESLFFVVIFITCFSCAVRMYYAKYVIGFNLRLYFTKVLVPIFSVIVLSLLAYYLFSMKVLLGDYHLQFIINVILTLIINVFLFFHCILEKQEKIKLIEVVKNMALKLNNSFN